MSALLVKNPSAELHDWLRNEAHFNRRSLNQQILLCLEWCMHTYGAAQRRDPFAKVKTARAEVPAFVHGEELVRKLMSQTGIDAKTAAQMRRAAKNVRQTKDRKTFRASPSPMKLPNVLGVSRRNYDANLSKSPPLTS